MTPPTAGMDEGLVCDNLTFIDISNKGIKYVNNMWRHEHKQQIRVVK